MTAARRPDGPEELDRLQQVAGELYGLPPEEFTAARITAVKQARAEGNRSLAQAVGALRRPAVAAWAVNIAIRERAGLLGQVTSMGDALRDAQAQLDGAALRDLNRQRRQLVAAVAAEVGAVAAEHGHRLSAAAGRQVEETVQAALVDPRAAAAVRSGVLVQPLTSTGVESLAEAIGVPLAEGAAEAAPDRRSTDRDSDDAAGDEGGGRPALSLVTADEQEARRAAQERAAAADRAVRKAAKARDKAVASRGRAQARVLQLESEVEELRGRLAEAEAQAEDAARRLAAKETAAEEADERLRLAQEAAAAAAREAADPR